MPRDPAAVARHAELAGGVKAQRVAPAGGGVCIADAAPAEAREHPTAGRLVRHAPALAPTRSEEHTSELQSQSNLVCRLLLEKKKKQRKRKIITRLQVPKSNTTATKVTITG